MPSKVADMKEKGKY